MFTVCPKCALTLAVTADDLRVGQGYVRCGRCSNVFNALLTLSEEPAPAGATSPAPTPPPAEVLPSHAEPPPASGPPPSATTPELAEHDVTFVVDTSEPSPPTSGTVTEEVRNTGTFETIVLEGDAITQTEELVPEESVDHELAAIAQQIAAAGAAGSAGDHAAADAAENAGGASVTEDIAASLAPPPEAPSHALAWGAGAVAMLLLLGLQVAHHWRNDLAALPTLNGPLTRLYAALHLPLAPHWDLGAYEVHQLGAEAAPGVTGAISVRMALMNRAERPQPAPIIRLTLLDRYGKRLAGRDLPPKEYLRAPPGGGFLAAGQRVDGEVSVIDPGPEASSFELDVCLPGAGGVPRCASEQGAPAPGR